MEETPNLDTALDGAVSSLSTDSSQEEVTETQATEAPQQTQKPQQEETYTRIDPSTLSPELQSMHKSLLGDYTRKTQALAAQRKQMEEKAAQFEQMQQGMSQHSVQRPQETVQQTHALQPDPNWSLEQYTQFMNEQMQQQIAQFQEQQVMQNEEQLASHALFEFESADERLNSESPAYDETMRIFVGSKLDALKDDYVDEYRTLQGFSVPQHTQELVKAFEQYQQQHFERQAKQKTQEALSQAKKLAPLGARSGVAKTSAVSSSIDDAMNQALSALQD
ncbi:MAG: hypothetical protein M3Q81_05710 [bacterium]|nr:hypothetical protein [bacterium]